MKMLKGFTILLSMMFVLGVMKAAQAELQPIYGPIYVTKAKDEGKKKEAVAETTAATTAVKVEKEAKLRFIAPVPGAGIIVIKNGGDSGKKQRVSSAEIKLNGVEVAHESDFNKNVDVLQYDVQLLQMNELEVEVKSCKECEIEITILGEKLPVRLPSR